MPSLPIRIAIGAAIFAALAIWDWWKNRQKATRWREYSFLLGSVGAALLYGVVNDQITSRISWEYFYYGKGLSEVLPAEPVPHPRLYWEAAKVGLQATWTAGLIIGVGILLANNPSRKSPALSYTRLMQALLLVFACTATVAVVGGLAGYNGMFVHTSRDFAEMVRNDEFRPRQFMTVYGIHLGEYIGALVGLAVAVAWIRLKRKAITNAVERHPEGTPEGSIG